MICHRLRCIFVHIPRTARSSIEKWLFGADWWTVDPATKHLTATQARQRYAAHWDSYFKFSFVRHPLTRVASMLHHGAFYGVSMDASGDLDFTGYHHRFGYNPVLEYDDRFHTPECVRAHRLKPDCVYGNLLGEELDFVGKFEHLAASLEHIRSALHVQAPFDAHLERSTVPVPVAEFSPRAREQVTAMYRGDFEDCEYDPANPADR